MQIEGGFAGPLFQEQKPESVKGSGMGLKIIIVSRNSPGADPMSTYKPRWLAGPTAGTPQLGIQPPHEHVGAIRLFQ